MSAKKADFQAIGEKFHIDPVIARIIRNRDVLEDKEIETYLKGDLNKMHSPYLLKDMEKAVLILEEKINNSCRLNELQQEMKKAQKDLALSLNDGTYSEKKEVLIKLQDEFYNDPLVVNYHLLQEEIINKLNELKEKIK